MQEILVKLKITRCHFSSCNKSSFRNSFADRSKVIKWTVYSSLHVEVSVDAEIRDAVSVSIALCVYACKVNYAKRKQGNKTEY